MYAAFDPTLQPWRFQPHPQVWLLIAFLIAAYVYAVRVIGPDAVPTGQPIVTRRQIGAFAGAMLLLWAASDWPMHDISEEYLYSAHMLQHMVLAFFVPPLALLATPAWLMRAIVGQRPGLCGVQLVDEADRRRRAVQHRGDGHPHPGRGEQLGGELTAPLLGPPARRDVGTADVDAGLRSAAGAATRLGRQDGLPVPAVGHTDRAGGLVDVRRRRRLHALRRPRAGVRPLRHQRPAGGRPDHEARRRAVPLGDHRGHLLQAVRGQLLREQQLPPWAPASRTPRSRATMPTR